MTGEVMGEKRWAAVCWATVVPSDSHPQISSLGMTRLHFRSHAVGRGAMPLRRLSLGADRTDSFRVHPPPRFPSKGWSAEGKEQQVPSIHSRGYGPLATTRHTVQPHLRGQEV